MKIDISYFPQVYLHIKSRNYYLALFQSLDCTNTIAEQGKYSIVYISLRNGQVFHRETHEFFDKFRLVAWEDICPSVLWALAKTFIKALQELSDGRLIAPYRTIGKREENKFKTLSTIKITDESNKDLETLGSTEANQWLLGTTDTIHQEHD